MRKSQQTWRERLGRAVAECEKQAQRSGTELSYPKPPATREKISAAEKHVGFRLSGDHKEFLAEADGWDEAFLSWAIFGVDDLARRRGNDTLEHEGQAAYLKQLGLQVSDVLIVGTGIASISSLIFVSAASRFLPGQFLWWHTDEVARYSDFASAFDDFLRLLQEGDNGND